MKEMACVQIVRPVLAGLLHPELTSPRVYALFSKMVNKLSEGSDSLSAELFKGLWANIRLQVIISLSSIPSEISSQPSDEARVEEVDEMSTVAAEITDKRTKRTPKAQEQFIIEQSVAHVLQELLHEAQSFGDTRSLSELTSIDQEIFKATFSDKACSFSRSLHSHD